MANGTQRTSDLTNWQLAGLREEITKTEQRLKYLHDEQRRLTGQAMTGTTRTTKTKTPPKRKRTITAETREKMRQGALKRWHGKPAITPSEPQAQDAPAPVVSQ